MLSVLISVRDGILPPDHVYVCVLDSVLSILIDKHRDEPDANVYLICEMMLVIMDDRSLHFLSFFHIWILITSLVSSNSSYPIIS